MDTPELTPKRVLGIIGSPRRGGNTEMLVDEALRGAAEAGAIVEKVRLNDLEIGYCQACQSCWNTGHCFQQDDMPALLEKMNQSQGWILGTPVYFQGPSAQFKVFIDRWFGQGKVVNFPGRRVVLTISLGAAEDKARHVVGMVEGFCAHLKMDLVAKVIAPNIWDSGKVHAYPEILAAAYQAGKEVAA